LDYLGIIEELAREHRRERRFGANNNAQTTESSLGWSTLDGGSSGEGKIKP